MTTKSAITWTEATWSPVTGCDPLSPGCKNCYAKREVETRWSKNPKSVFFGRAFNDVQFHPDALEQPLHWKKGRMIFVCPRADLFHEAVPEEFLVQVFGIMAGAPQHTYQVLTKRPARMREFLRRFETEVGVRDFVKYWPQAETMTWPLANVWIGITVENQETADERIPLLLETPAAVRWISAEPLIEPVTIFSLDGPVDVPDGAKSPIDWVVSGGESGEKARPMPLEWARRLCLQCGIVGVPFLHKQNGEWIEASQLPADITLPARHWALVDIQTGEFYTREEGCFSKPAPHQVIMGRVGIRKAGRLLDGVLHDAYPEVRS